jgi:hypothetical protein
MEKITANVARKRVEVEFEGNYSGDVAGFAEKLKTSARAAKAGGSHFDILSDFTQSHVLPQQMLGETADVLSWCTDNGLRKAANIVGSVLLKMQLERLAPADSFRSFISREEAEAWLDE